MKQEKFRGLNFRQIEVTRSMENVIYNELRKRLDIFWLQIVGQ